MGGDMAIQLQALLKHTLTELGPREMSEEAITNLMAHASNVGVAVLVPIFAILPIVAIAVTMVQTGPMFTGHSLKPDLQRVNPLTALKRLFSPRSLVELVKALVKVGVISVLVSRLYMESTSALLSLGAVDIGSSIPVLIDLVMRMGQMAAVALLSLAALDYAYQRWDFRHSNMMSKEDLKEENKQNEGSPQVRQRIRAMQRQFARGRMMQAIPTADVVITNPTHLAIALSYRGEDMVAPKVVAKGADHVAARIREIARQHNVPLVENKPLAQALYRSVDVGTEIPAALFQAVAEVLAYIYRLRARSPMREVGYGAGA
jgi:flagellar biosynthetic protein FlhB